MLARVFDGLRHFAPDIQIVEAFDLPRALQYYWRRLAESPEGDGSSISEEEEDSEEDAPVDAVAWLRMSTDDRREYLRSLPGEVRRDFLRALQARLQELEE